MTDSPPVMVGVVDSAAFDWLGRDRRREIEWTTRYSPALTAPD